MLLIRVSLKIRKQCSYVINAKPSQYAIHFFYRNKNYTEIFMIKMSYIYLYVLCLNCIDSSHKEFEITVFLRLTNTA